MHVLVANCGLPHSEVAVRQCAHIVKVTGGIPTILTVIKHFSGKPLADAILTHSTSIMMTLDIDSMRTKIRMGLPAKEIVSETEEGNYKLAIAGTRSTHNLLKRLMGSTARQVMEKAKCPVLIVKGRASPIRRILICVRGSEFPPLLTHFTTQFASMLTYGTEVTILYVLPSTTACLCTSGRDQFEGVESKLRTHTRESELLDHDVQVLEKSHVAYHQKIRSGLVVEEILSEARDGYYDLIAIGTSQREARNRIHDNKLLCQIVDRVDRPILVVK